MAPQRPPRSLLSRFSLPRSFMGWQIATAFALALLATGQAAGQPAIDMTGQSIPYLEHAAVRVGQSVVVHGARGACGEPPPSWDITARELPPLAIGRWSDGGVGYCRSRSCGGRTPARAVVFTAAKPGEERLLLFGDPVSIRVEQELGVEA